MGTQARRRKPRASASAASAATILCVDDDPDQLVSLRLYLKGEGYRVITSVSAPESLGSLDECLPDLIITDQNMPGMTGADFCRRLRARPATQAIPVILYSALAEPPDASLYDRIYKKPAEFAALGQDIRGLLTPHPRTPH